MFWQTFLSNFLVCLALKNWPGNICTGLPTNTEISHSLECTSKLNSLKDPLLENSHGITFVSPSSATIDPQGSKNLRHLELENTGGNHDQEVTPHDFFSPQAADIFDHDQYINEYHEYQEQIQHEMASKESPTHLFPMEGTTHGTQKLLDHSLRDDKDIHEKEHSTTNIEMLESHPSVSTQASDPINSIFLNPIAGEEHTTNLSGNKRKEDHQLQSNGVFDSGTHSFEESTLKRNRKELDLSPDQDDDYIHYLETHLHSISDDPVVRKEGTDDVEISSSLQKGSKPSRFPEIHGNHVYQSIQESQSNVGRDTFVLLHKIGILSAVRSPSLCYEIFEFFLGIHNTIKERNEGNLEAMRAVRIAIRGAAHKVVMAFLGILRVFEVGESGENDIESVINNGWIFMKDFYGRWKDAKPKNLYFGQSVEFDPKLSFDSDFHLRYLKDKAFHQLSFSMVHSFSLLWSKQIGQSRVPKDICNYTKKVEEIWETDSKSSKGGLYGRTNIKNYAFWGPEQFERSNWHVYGKEHISPKEIWHFSSNAAQFHTPIGRELCKELHAFFEDLIQTLHFSYNKINHQDASQNIPTQSIDQLNKVQSEHLGLIVKAVSLAQYRVIVPFIGLIRILNQKKLTADQLDRLIQNALNFVKLTFSKWKTLNFCSKNHAGLFFAPDVNKFKVILVSGSPGSMFQFLTGFAKETGSFPFQPILELLRSWQISITTSKPGSEYHLDFDIMGIPTTSYKKLSKHVVKHLGDCHSQDDRSHSLPIERK
ncbi:hypothetical protein DFH28DRAFT_1023191 [Melampsora americana]|nr:hypothetical protein DFH28DRAFT_1023191 [Melampsora americana]